MSSLKQEGIKKMFKKQTDENAGTTPTIYSCFEKVSEGPKFASPSTRTALREIQASSVDHIQAARTIKVIQPTKNNADVDESDCLRRMLCGEEANEDFYQELAEQTRAALVEACEENKKLTKENELLHQRIDNMEKELSGLMEYKLLYKLHNLNQFLLDES